MSLLNEESPILVELRKNINQSFALSTRHLNQLIAEYEQDMNPKNLKNALEYIEETRPAYYANVTMHYVQQMEELIGICPKTDPNTGLPACQVALNIGMELIMSMPPHGSLMETELLYHDAIVGLSHAWMHFMNGYTCLPIILNGFTSVYADHDHDPLTYSYDEGGDTGDRHEDIHPLFEGPGYKLFLLAMHDEMERAENRFFDHIELITENNRHPDGSSDEYPVLDFKMLIQENKLMMADKVQRFVDNDEFDEAHLWESNFLEHRKEVLKGGIIAREEDHGVNCATWECTFLAYSDSLRHWPDARLKKRDTEKN